MSPLFTLASGLLLVLLSPSATGDDSLGQLLEKGIYLEETAGDLDGATEIYGRIVAKNKAEASLAAQAYYRLGACRLKQGKADKAAATFKQLVQRFPREKEWVDKAKAELGKLDQAGNAPRVIRTDPVAFKRDVSWELDEITVTFDRPMTDKSWSWTGGGETFPKTTDKPFYNEDRTVCTMPVQLEPGKVYWVGINSPSFQNFKSEDGVPARRFVIVFATAGTDGKPTEIPADMLREARQINTAPRPSESRSAAPVVVATDPPAFQRDVSPNLDKITVTFDRRMTDQSWSWTGGGETYPKVTDKPSYNADRTVCTLPVKLEPAKAYWVGINSPSHRNFRSANGVPARRYVVLFATAGTDGKPTEIPEDMLAQARSINEASAQASGAKPASPADKIKAEALAAKGWRLWNQQKFEPAEEAFAESVKLDATDANAWNGLGWSQFNEGKPLAAREAFEKAVQLEPKHAAALNGLGWVAKGQGKKEQAIEYWEKAVAALPTGTAALNGLARTYMEDGEYEKAAKYYQMWLKAEPNNQDAKAGLAKAKEKMN